MSSSSSSLLVIKNGTVVNHDRRFAADVYCRDGKIAAVVVPAATPGASGGIMGDGGDWSGAQVIDARGMYVMPGGIDPHTHLQMPFMGTVTVDDWESGTRCAVAGGTTTVIDFIIQPKNSSLLSAFNSWKERAAGKAHCNYGFHCAVTTWNPSVSEEYALMAKEGVTSFKHFMAYKGALMLNDTELIESFLRCKELGLLPSVHAENGDLIFWAQKSLIAKGITGPIGHPLSRPSQVEGEAVQRACVIARQVGTPLVVVHNTSAPAVDAIVRAQQSGQVVFGETTAIHLTLDESRYSDPNWDVAAHHVLSPPLRSKTDVEYLWNALHAGGLQYIATDHCTFSTEQKRMGKADFSRIPNGCPGLEERMLVVWQGGVVSGRMSLEKFVDSTSTFAARLYNMFPNKGTIMVGSDADIVLWDPNTPRTISSKTHQSKIDYNVFEGFTSSGSPSVTIVGGRVVYQNGAVHPSCTGHFVPRTPFGLAYNM